MLAGDHGSVVPDEALQAVQSRPIRQHHRPSVISHVPPGGLYVVEQLLNGYLQATGEGSQNTADAAARGLCPPPPAATVAAAVDRAMFAVVAIAKDT